MSIFSAVPSVAVYQSPSLDAFETVIKPREQPAILKGLTDHWPAVQAGRQSPEALCSLLDSLAAPVPVRALAGAAATRGRFFYSDDLIGRNHHALNLSFAELTRALLHLKDAPEPDFLYGGSLPLFKHLPGLPAQCPMPLLRPEFRPLASLWIGNHIHVPAHWDEAKNLACVIAGRRRFMLFPVEQIGNLYFGPYENTIAGQAVSLVDFDAPDFERFPKFKDALRSAQIAELEAGDVLYMPSLWIHQVQSLERFGAMINFWWQEVPAHMLSPSDTLIHGFLTLKDRPLEERKKWQAIFEHYLFNPDHPLAHVPPPARGIFGTMTAEMYAAGKRIAIRALGGSA